MYSLRFGELYEGGFYHVYNRGVDKRVIFHDKKDIERFILLVQAVNSEQKIEGISHLQRGDIQEFIQEISREQQLVHIISFSLVRNHFHFVLRQNKKDGISRFMQKVSAGYAKYYNQRYDRVGALFQGRFKFTCIETDEKLMRLIAYVNRNHEIHEQNTPTCRPPRTTSGHQHYIDFGNDIRSFVLVEEGLSLFGNSKNYQRISREVVRETIQNRTMNKEIKNELLE